MPTAIIMVGASGAGKSTWIENNTREDTVICSADHWFEDFNGKYKFDPAQLSRAHGVCLKKFNRSLIYEKNVVCDNTNTTVDQVAPYIALAVAFKYNIRVVFLDTPPDVCISRNTKGVPRHTIERMYVQATEMLRNWPSHWPEWERVPFEYELPEGWYAGDE